MPTYCPNCGKNIPENVKFCPECGADISSLLQKSVPQENIEKKQVSETSRFSGLKIEKYLLPNEILIFATRGSLYVGGEADQKGYVTKNRVLFFSSKGLIIKSDRLHEIPVNDIKNFKIVEEGLILKTMYLQLNDLIIKGERNDILELYRAIQTVKHAK